MGATATTEFRGFERGAIQFLTELADHNDRAWFQARKGDYERLLKEPLEAFPLESIQMLGTITQDKETFALVKAGPNLYRVKKGNYMGQNFGVITSIDEGGIKLKELVQDGTGEWVERASALQLVEVQK